MLLYGRSLTIRELSDAAEAALGAGANDIRVRMFLSEVHPGEALDYGRLRSFVKYQVLSADKSHLSASVSGVYGRLHVREIGGRFNALRHPSYPKVWLVVSHENIEFFKKPLADLMRGATPRLVRPILRTPQLHAIFSVIASIRAVSDVRMRQLGLRGRIASRGADRRIERDRRWTDLGVDEAFHEAVEGGQWVNDATAEYRLNNQFSGRITVGRSGSFRFERRFAAIAQRALDLTAGYTTSWFEFLKDRDRREESQYRSRPFRLEFNYPVLTVADGVKRLADVLSNMSHTTFTVLHGNPFFHAVIVDYSDGSTSEVLVLDQTGLIVIPQGRATVNSLRRICAQIFSAFREGEFQEVGQ